MRRLGRLCGLTLLLTGCGDEPLTIEELVDEATQVFQDDFFEGEEEYSASGSVEALKVPPQLSLPDTSGQLVIPSLEGVSAKATGRGTQAAVLPEFLEMKIRREGMVRWLEVGAAPIAVWPHLQEFWKQQGFELVVEQPTLGIIETQWRNAVQDTAEVEDSQHFTAVREKFRVRIEREPTGYANLFVTRQSLEVAGLNENNKVVWKSGRPDPEEEAEMLVRIMEHFGASRLEGVATLEEEEVESTVRLDIENISGIPVLVVEDDYSSVWRQVSVALERSGLYLVDTDRTAGTVVFRYRGRGASSDEGLLLEARLLERAQGITLVTAHHHEQSGPLSRTLTREVLRHVVAAYTLTPRSVAQDK